MLSMLAAATLLQPVTASQVTERVSVDSAGVQGNGESGSSGSLSTDGRFVAFGSDASNLVPGDTNQATDVFVRDRRSGTTTRVSVSSLGGQGSGASDRPVISADGRFVAFHSVAPDLVAGDTNGVSDVFIHHIPSGSTRRVSVDSVGVQGDRTSEWPYLSGDGRFVSFQSDARNLVAGDTNGAKDAFVHDLASGQTQRVSVDSLGVQGNGHSYVPGLSSDGRYVAFGSSASNLVPGDTNAVVDAFVHDRLTGQTRRASVSSTGVQGNGWSEWPSVSDDGQIVAYYSSASNLVPADSNGTVDVFVHDLSTGQTRRVSVSSGGAQANAGSYAALLSADGRFVVFDSWASNLVSGDTNGTRDVFVHELATSITSRVSLSTSGVQGNHFSFDSAISADGRFVVFPSYASNLVSGDTNGAWDMFVHDRALPGVSLARTGTCPGPVTLTIKYATPNGWVAILYGASGAFVQTGPPCAGLALQIATPSLRRYVRAGAGGGMQFITMPTAAACGLTVQVVDMASCAASNAVVL